MSGSEILAALLGLLAPIVNAWFKRWGLGEKEQNVIILSFLIVVSGVMMIGSGEISLSGCAGMGLEECFGVVYKYLGLVVGGAFVSYKMFFQALGIDDRIAGK